jgi:hypothetical protein
MVKGEIFFIFFKDIEYYYEEEEEEEAVIREKLVELSFKMLPEQLMPGVLVVGAVS